MSEIDWYDYDDLIPTAQAGEMLNVSPRWIRYLLANGKLEGKQLGPRFWAVSKESVEALQAAREVKQRQK